MKRITVPFPERDGLQKKNRFKAIPPGWLLHGRKGQETDDVDDQAELEHILGEQEENSRQLLINSIIEKIGLRYPICYPTCTTFASTARAVTCQSLMLSC